MKHHGLLAPLAKLLEDKRRDNQHIPFDILLALAVTAKLKLKTSLTDVPFAVNDAALLAELGWNVWDTGRDILKTALEVPPCIHILDCTKIPVNLDNENYEEASIVKIDGEILCGYKLGVLRGLLDDSGVVEEITFGTTKTHDMEQCRELLRNTSCFKENDILINDKGFLSREMTNYLKNERKVDTYLPVKENMILYLDAVQLAITSGKWHRFPKAPVLKSVLYGGGSHPRIAKR